MGAPAASDAFGKVADDCGAAADLFAKTGPTVGELASKSATVAGAALAGVLMPGSLVVSGVGALVGGSVTRLAVAPTLVEGRYKAMQAKIAGLLRDAAVAGDWTTVTSAEVDAVVREYGLPGDYSAALLCQIYNKYLLEVMRMPDVKTAEMNDLVALREILGLDAEAAGNAHYDVAVEVYGQLQWTGDEVLKDPESAEHKTVSKLLFLSDRAFAGTAADSVSDEAYGYEVGRVRAVFGLEQSDLEDRCSAIAAPFYDRALAGTLEKLDSVNPDMLARARAKLGINDQTTADMHLDCYTAEVGELLAANGNSLSDADDARLESLATILAVPKDAAAEATATLTVPLYVAATRDAVEAGIGADDAAAAALGPSLDKMKVDLRLTDSAAEGVFRSAVREVLAAPYKAATDALKLQNTPGALASVSRLMDVQKGVETVVKTAPFLSGADAGSFFDDLLGVTGKSLPLSLYKLVYVEKLGDALDDGAKAELGALAKTLSLTPSDTALVHEQILAPKLDIKLGEVLREATPDRTDLDAWVANVDFPAALLKEKMDRAYADRIRAYSSENSILSVERKAQLDSLQAFLELSDEDVYAAKKATFLPTYAKSALEAMGASGGGIVADEYKEGLAKLQARLDLRDEDAQTAFAAAAKDRLRPLVEGVVGAFEEIVLTPEQLAKKRGIDAGDDLNVDKGAGGTFGIDEGAAVGAGSPEKVLSELAAVVDFVLGNGLATEPAELGGAWTYAVDCAALVPPDLRADLFKQCVLSSLQVSEGDAITDAKKERYANAVFHLPGVLGVDDVDAAKAKQEVGTTIAQKYCGAALGQKATLDGADAAFVANLEEKLGVDLGDVSFAAKKNALLDKLNKVSQGYNDPNTAAKAAEVRDAAVAMGIDLTKDLGLPANKVQALFAAEAVAAIEGDDGDAAAAVGDVADGYGLGADEASSYLVALADKVCLECIDNAKADLIMKKPVNACESLDKLLLYHQFANLDDGALGAAAASKKDEMVSLYANYCNARGPEIEAKAVALKELMA